MNAYDILIKHKTGGGYSPITSECDGSSATFKTNLYCDISLATLTASPFLYVLGDVVIV